MCPWLQDDFAAALLDPGRELPSGLTAQNSRSPERRFAVYRNNVVVGLANALARRFPATRRIVGQEFFAAMARVFVAAHPPRSPILMQYGEEFPDFIAGFEPAQEIVYLPDVARLEAALTRAYHAADAQPADANQLAGLDDEALGHLRILLHPSVQIVRSRHPVVSLWAMNVGNAEIMPIEDWRGEDALVVRPALDVLVHRLPPGGAVFLSTLLQGDPLPAAVEAARADSPAFDLVVNLAGLIASGAVTGVSCTHPREERSP
jgi:hypothetical protein